MTIGEKITQRRLAAHLSQEILAERLGVSTQDVSRWESGEVLPDAEKLLQLCRVFGISADELLGENAKADDASDFLSLPLWRWSLRVISPPLAFAGTAAALTGSFCNCPDCPQLLYLINYFILLKNIHLSNNF